MSHESSHASANTSVKSSFFSSLWFALLLAGLFIASVNFVRVMSHDEGGHGDAHATEAHQESHAHPAGH